MEEILVDSVKGKELHMHKYKKHPRLCPNSMINGLTFFLFFPLSIFFNLLFFYYGLALCFGVMEFVEPAKQPPTRETNSSTGQGAGTLSRATT